MPSKHKSLQPSSDLTREEFETIVTGNDLIYLSGFLTAHMLRNWALHGYLLPLNLSMHGLFFGDEDMSYQGYRFGEVVNVFRQQAVREDIVQNLISKFRLTYGFTNSSSKNLSEQNFNNNLNKKEKISYLKVIAALCSCQGKIDILSREATGQIRIALQKIGLDLNDDTIKKIKDEVKHVIDKQNT